MSALERVLKGLPEEGRREFLEANRPVFQAMERAFEHAENEEEVLQLLKEHLDPEDLQEALHALKRVETYREAHG